MVDTVREPLIVLDKNLRVVAASRSFYVKFTTDPEDTQGKYFYELGDGAWDIPKLRLLLEIIPDHDAMDEYEVEHEFPRIGRRVLLLNARIVRYGKAHTNIMLGIEDITVQRDLREKDVLLRQKGVLLDEVQHRVANSLQIIASIIMMKALSAQSEETRGHLLTLTTGSFRPQPCNNTFTLRERSAQWKCNPTYRSFVRRWPIRWLARTSQSR
jgi:hypothetical protein